MAKIRINTLEKAQLLFPELRPEDKGDYFLMYCPECGHKEAFLYKSGSNITCNRRDKCGFHISIFDYLKSNNRLKLSGIIPSDAPETPQSNDEASKKQLILPKGIKFFSEASGVICDKFKNYLKKRKINNKFIDSLGYVFGSDDKFDGSIFIPFFENGEINYFICRKVSGDIRYLNSDVSATDKVFNLDGIEEGKDVFIFEGVFDAMSINENQISTAMLTNNFSKEKISKIIDRAPRNIIMVPDIDFAGVCSLEKNLRRISMLIPPSLNIGIYIYIIDKENFSKLYAITRSNNPTQKKIELGKKIVPVNKDFNDFVKNGNSNYIDIDDCIKWSPSEMDDLVLSLWI